MTIKYFKQNSDTVIKYLNWRIFIGTQNRIYLKKKFTCLDSKSLLVRKQVNLLEQPFFLQGIKMALQQKISK